MIISIAMLVIVGVVWKSNTILSGQLQTSVNALGHWPGLETKWLYAGLLGFTASFPLIFGFLPQLKFYRVWRPLLLANLPVSIFFILWDAYFAARGAWGFSPAYTTGLTFAGLPWEEILFFMIIPSACIFIYWSLNAVIPREPFRTAEAGITLGLAILLLAMGLWRWEQIYTSTTCLLTAGFLLIHRLVVPAGYRGRFFLAYLVSCIPFLVINGILTGALTAGPVVLYNPDEYSGIRAGTVPVDDFAYSFLMLFANVTLFEAFRPSRAT